MSILGKERHFYSSYCFINVILFVTKIYLDFFGSIPNVIFVVYVIVKGPHDELSICYMTFAYL
jgi:hypothetical protein